MQFCLKDNVGRLIWYAATLSRKSQARLVLSRSVSCFSAFQCTIRLFKKIGIAKDAANESLIPSHGAVSDLNRREEYLVPAAQFSAHSQRAFSRLFTPFPCLFTPFPCLRPARDGPRLRQAVPTHSMTSPADSSITEAGFPPHENDRPIASKFHRLRCIIFPICPEIE